MNLETNGMSRDIGLKFVLYVHVINIVKHQAARNQLKIQQMMSMTRVDILVAELKGYDACFSLIEQHMTIQTNMILNSFQDLKAIFMPFFLVQYLQEGKYRSYLHTTFFLTTLITFFSTIAKNVEKDNFSLDVYSSIILPFNCSRSLFADRQLIAAPSY